MAIPAVLRELNANVAAIFAEASVDRALFDDPNNLIPTETLARLMALSVERTRCEDFGLRVGARAAPSSLGVPSLLAQQAPDVRSALTDIVTYLHLHDRGGVAALNISGNVAVLSYSIYAPLPCGGEQICDGAIAIGFNILRALCGTHWLPDEVLLPRRRPSDPLPFQDFFRAPIRFGAEEAALVFHARWLSKRQEHADPALHRLIKEGFVDPYDERQDDLPSRVRRVLRTMMVDGHYHGSGVVESLRIKRWTLDRKLGRCGTSLGRLTEEIRFDVARQLMANSDRTFAEIAAKLGYSEASVFTRAFRRWSGMSPTGWRASQAEG